MTDLITTITPTGWVQIGLVVLAMIGLVYIAFSHVTAGAINIDDEPIYRTADGGILSADARTALRNANAPLASHPATCCNLATIRREATAVAILDLGRKPGLPPTPNPYTQGTLPFTAWRSQYNRVTDGQWGAT